MLLDTASTHPESPEKHEGPICFCDKNYVYKILIFFNYFFIFLNYFDMLITKINF
jgi:hypothetical protein